MSWAELKKWNQNVMDDTITTLRAQLAEKEAELTKRDKRIAELEEDKTVFGKLFDQQVAQIDSLQAEKSALEHRAGYARHREDCDFKPFLQKVAPCSERWKKCTCGLDGVQKGEPSTEKVRAGSYKIDPSECSHSLCNPNPDGTETCHYCGADFGVPRGLDDGKAVEG